MPLTVAELARQIGGAVEGNDAIELRGFAPAPTAQPGDVTFAENEVYFELADKSAASAIIVGPEFTSQTAKTLIRVANPRIAFARALALFFPEPHFEPGRHPTAVIAASARIDERAHIGPYCMVGERCRIGAGSVIQGLAFVGDDCEIGEETRLFPRVTLYPRTVLGRRVRVHSGTVVGSDGYGYVLDEGKHRKIPHTGYVHVHDDVEIGANVTIDRGALAATVIGRGTKIDNLVQIAHSVQVGEHCIVVAQVGIAGSTKLGNYVTLAGQSGVAGHLTLGDRVVVMGKSGVMRSIGAGEKWFGYPAKPDRQMKRQLVVMDQLPELLNRVIELEKKLSSLAPGGAAPQSPAQA